MSEESRPKYTHFEMTGAELPVEYYIAIGRALYRWSQLEAVINAISTSSRSTAWLTTMETLRGRKGFNVKGNFDLLRKAVRRSGENEIAVGVIEKAEELYEARKVFFHSAWGHVTGEGVVAVGIQEWSNTTYDNFCDVSLLDLNDFGKNCCAVWVELLETVVPLLHGADAAVIDDIDGIARGI